MPYLKVKLLDGIEINEYESSYENAAADLYNYYILDQDLEDKIKEVTIS